jgi:hypothetical protein
MLSFLSTKLEMKDFRTVLSKIPTLEIISSMVPRFMISSKSLLRNSVSRSEDEHPHTNPMAMIDPMEQPM